MHQYLATQKVLTITKFIILQRIPMPGLCALPLYGIPYIQQYMYWRELNLAVEPKIAIARILADLNMAVRYGIAIHVRIYMQVGNFGGF